MNIPRELEDWAAKMESGAATRQVLANLEAEGCIEPDREQEFWTRLASNWRGERPMHAWEAAKEAVSRPSALHFLRRSVPEDRFAVAVRFTLPDRLRHMFPDISIIGSGLTPQEFQELSIEEVADIVGEAGLASQVVLGRPGDAGSVVWVSEASEDLTSLEGNSAELMDRLGLPDHREWVLAGGPCLRLEYRRDALPPDVRLHVPSALDGIAHASFRPETDCAAPAGRSHPYHSSDGCGLPEAVHGGCVVTSFAISLLQA